MVPLHLFVIICSTLIALVTAHMQMKYPAPRGTPGYPSTGHADYNLNAPLGSTQMCGGKAPGSPVASFNAGETINVQFAGEARHGGGLCQFALSYDDKTFVVIEQILGGCPNTSNSWPVKLPSNLPNCNRCTFAWTWVNAIGNREFYMNCADIVIRGSNSGNQIKGRSLYIANLPGYAQYQPPAKDGGPQESQISHFPIMAY